MSMHIFCRKKLLLTKTLKASFTKIGGGEIFWYPKDRQGTNKTVIHSLTYPPTGSSLAIWWSIKQKKCVRVSYSFSSIHTLSREDWAPIFYHSPCVTYNLVLFYKSCPWMTSRFFEGRVRGFVTLSLVHGSLRRWKVLKIAKNVI